MKKKPTLFVTRKMPPLVTERASKSYNAKFNDADLVFKGKEIVEAAQGADGLLIVNEIINQETIFNLPGTVKIIACFTAGYDHVDLSAAEERGIVVTNAPDALTDAVADITLLLLLGASRRASEGEAVMRSGNWPGWHALYMVGSALGGKRLGILGMGRIGRAVAQRAAAFGLKIHYHNRSRLDADLEAGAIWHENPEALLQSSDILSLHCPLNDSSRNFLNSERIALLPKGAIIVNTARGDLVDDKALIEALKSGHIKSAGLDVYQGEPNNINQGYALLKNTFLLPHIGSATIEARTGMGFQALDNLDAYFNGRELPNKLV